MNIKANDERFFFRGGRGKRNKKSKTIRRQRETVDDEANIKRKIKKSLIVTDMRRIMMMNG